MKQYLVIDQKSFYVTVECVARGLDPMTTNLVITDPECSENMICLTIFPKLKRLLFCTTPSEFSLYRTKM